MEIKVLDDSTLSKYIQGRIKDLSHTHSGAKTQLSLHFVKTGKLEKELGMLYGDLFDLRQKGDQLQQTEYR
jgi:uncharacterized protein (UPF0332 family)